MTVRVPTVEIEREVDTRLAKVGRTAKLKGFRPGKIPPKVVRQRYGGQVRQEVISDAIRASYSRALAQENLSPAGGPSIEPLSEESEEHFSYQATFEVYPEVKLKPTTGIAVQTPSVEIGEADVDAMLEKLRDQRADWATVERKSGVGDRVVVDFVGRIDKEVFEGGEGSEVPVIIGDGQVIEDFEKALKGVVAEQSKSAKVKFPKDYPAPALAGKKAVFDITVHRVEEKVLPEIDAEFLKSLGIEEGGLEALRTDINGNMERELSERLKVETKNRALDGLLKANSIEVPKGMVEEEIKAMQAEAMRRLGVEDPEQAPPRANFEAAAGRRVALSLLVQELIRETDIKLDPSRVDARIKELAAPYEKPEEISQIYRSNRDLMSQVESGVLEDQVVGFILEHGKVTEKAMSFKDFMT